MDLLKNLNWRTATKQFDTARKVPDADLELLKQAVQLSASSYGLQLYKVLIIEEATVREKLKPVSWGQNQLTDASHIFIFCHYAEAKDEYIDAYMQLQATTHGSDVNDLKGYGDFIKGKLAEKSEPERTAWMAKQTYIALGNLLAACAELKIDACPMEGFEAKEYNRILGLKEKGLEAAVVAAIGYRLEENQRPVSKKVRKPLTELFEII